MKSSSLQSLFFLAATAGNSFVSPLGHTGTTSLRGRKLNMKYTGEDQCPDDPDKVEPGVCGCGVPEDHTTDSDGDGVCDCADGCPNDAAKVEPGLCGCGVADDDSDFDGDGTPDCQDTDFVSPALFTGDVDISSPAVECGDSDGDGVKDCDDSCPDDPNKVTPGVCGCGTPDVDSDGNGTMDCNDSCPEDSSKDAPGVCGCGVPDVDSDGDGTMDCIDSCPDDPEKLEPGACDCGVSDEDSDNSGTPDCNEGDPDLSSPRTGGGKCVDDPTWQRGQPEENKDCNWVAGMQERRCGKDGTDGRFAYVACAWTCGQCAPSPAPSMPPTTSVDI